MDYPPCPYPPCTPAGGVSLGAYCPQKSLAVPHAAIDPGHDSPTELDWHRPSSNILINSPCQLYTRHIDTEHSLRSETQSSRSGIVSPSRVASPGSPKRQEITLLSSGSTTAANENLTMVTGTKRTYDESQSPIATSHGSSVPQLSKNPMAKPLGHRKIHCTVSSSHRNLSKPFRSPLISSTSRINTNTPSPQPTPSSMENEEADVSSSFSSNPTRGENRLAKPHLRSPLITVKSAGAASRPFRSPLTISHSSDSKSTLSSIDRRKIQFLEKKLTTLRQARKYRLDGSTSHLQGLAQKWKAAAREAAQELWTLAQSGFSNGGTEDHGTATTSHDDDSWKSWGHGNGKDDDVLSVLKGGSKGGAFRDNWGWDDAEVTLVEGHEHDDFLSGSWEPPSPATLGSQLAKPRRRASDKAKNFPDESDHLSHSRSAPDAQLVGNGRPDVDSEDGGESDVRAGECNIGTMLVQLGIAKETLGWNDAEEEFVD